MLYKLKTFSCICCCLIMFLCEKQMMLRSSQTVQYPSNNPNLLHAMDVYICDHEEFRFTNTIQSLDRAS